MDIKLSIEVYDKIIHWVRKANYEVSGFGKCYYDKDQKAIIVTSAHLLKQEGGAAVTDIDPTALSKLNYELREEPGELRFWWHSHVKMAAFWSGTDTDTIKQLGGNGWCCAIVFNQMEEYKAAYCGLAQTAIGETEVQLVDDIDMQIVYPGYDEDTVAAWDKEFTDNVTEKKYAPNVWTSGERHWDKPAGIIDATKGQSMLTHWAEADPNEADEPWHRDEAALFVMKDEAKLAGLTLKQYKKLLKRGDPLELDELYNKIDQGLAKRQLQKEDSYGDY